MRVAEDDDHRRRSQEEEETFSYVRSSVVDKLFNAATKNSEGEVLRSVDETIASATADKDRDMDEAVERAIAEYGRGLDRAVSEARANFEAEAAEDRKQGFKEAVSALR